MNKKSWLNKRVDWIKGLFEILLQCFHILALYMFLLVKFNNILICCKTLSFLVLFPGIYDSRLWLIREFLWFLFVESHLDLLMILMSMPIKPLNIGSYFSVKEESVKWWNPQTHGTSGNQLTIANSFRRNTASERGLIRLVMLTQRLLCICEIALLPKHTKFMNYPSISVICTHNCSYFH